MSISWFRILAAAVALHAMLCTAYAEPAAPAAPSGPAAAQAAPGSMLLTIFFKHDQSKTLSEINAELKKHGFYDKFPPDGIEVVSWYVVMGIGQVLTLRLPPERLREVNRIIEETAWGAYRTEFFPTYDYKAVAAEQRQRMRQQ